MKEVQVFANLSKPGAADLVLRAADLFRKAGVDTCIEPSLAEASGLEGLPRIPVGEMGRADLAVVFGGDGTVLRVAGFAAPHGTLVLGVHLGHIGFITYCRPEDLEKVVDQALRGKLPIEERIMVRAELRREGALVSTAHGLNEVAIQRRVTGKMMTFDISIDDVPVTRFPADGVLVATPTGSTAYSLSAGGPVTSPDLDALLLTQITPHTLVARPLILAPDSVVRVQVGSRGEAMMVADGYWHVSLNNGDEVVLSRAEFAAKLVLSHGHEFYERLRRRLLGGPREDEFDFG
jgi:NAD+ kinase